MLLPKNISPDDCIYCNAAYVLKVLLDKKKYTVADLYCDVRNQYTMSFSMFIHCLDWLYLIDSISFQNEEISLCS